MTPSGRFKPFADICLSASAFHPESWTPQWTVLSLVHGLRLHMLTNPQEIGGVMSSADDILEYARRSRAWKFAWMVGTTKIVVDHATLIEQGALAGIDEDNNNELRTYEPLKLDSERAPMTRPDRIRRQVSAEVTSVQQCALDAVTATGPLTYNDSIATQEIKLTEKNEKKRRRSLSHSTASPLVKTQHTIGSSKWVGRISIMVSKALANPVARSLFLLVVVWIISKQ